LKGSDELFDEQSFQHHDQRVDEDEVFNFKRVESYLIIGNL